MFDYWFLIYTFFFIIIIILRTHVNDVLFLVHFLGYCFVDFYLFIYFLFTAGGNSSPQGLGPEGGGPQPATMPAITASKQSSITTSGQRVVTCSGGKVWCEGNRGVSVQSLKAEGGKLQPSGNIQMKTPVPQDIVTAIVVSTKNPEKGYVGCLSGRITAFSPSSKTDLSWAAHSSKVTGLLLIEKASRTMLWSCSSDGFLKAWEGNGRGVSKSSGHRGEVVDLQHVPFSSGGGIIWSCGIDKTLRVWDKAGNAAAGAGSSRRPTQLKCSDPVNSLSVDFDQQVVWSADRSNIRAWSADTRNCVWCSKGGGTSICLTGDYVIALIDAGAHIAVWQRAITNEEGEIPPITVLSGYGTTNKLVSMVNDRVLLSNSQGMTCIIIENVKVDPQSEIVVEKETGESVGAIFKADSALVLERLEPGSAAERCGGVRFLGWQLVAVNSIPVTSVSDVRAAVRRQTTFTMQFKQQERSEGLVTPALRRIPSATVTVKRPSEPVGGLYNTTTGYAATPVQETHHQPSPRKKAERTSTGKTRTRPETTSVTSQSSRELIAVARRITSSAASEHELPSILEQFIQQRDADFNKQLEDLRETFTFQLTEKDGQIASLEKQLQEQGSSHLGATVRSAVEGSLGKMVQELKPVIAETVEPILQQVLEASQRSNIGVRTESGIAPNIQQMNNTTTTTATAASITSTEPSPETVLSRLSITITRCCDALGSLYSLSGFPEWCPPSSFMSIDLLAESLLKSMHNLHSEVCRKEGVTNTPDLQAVHQAVGLLTSRMMNGNGSSVSPVQVQPQAPVSPISVLTDPQPQLRGSTPATPPRPRRHSHRGQEDKMIESHYSETDIRHSPSPLTHASLPIATDEDAQWSRLFEMRNRLQQWLQWKPQQLADRGAQAKRAALERGIEAVDQATEEWKSYHAGERSEHEKIWEEVKTGLGATSPHGNSTSESLHNGWQKLKQAEDAFTTTLEKLRQQFGDTHTLAASLRNKIGEVCIRTSWMN